MSRFSVIKARAQKYNAPPLVNLVLSVTSASIDTAIAAGTLITNISNVPAGVTPTFSPNDGRFVIAGGSGAGWKLVVGMSAISAGSLSGKVSATGANDAIIAISIVTAGAGLISRPAGSAIGPVNIADTAAHTLNTTGTQQTISWASDTTNNDCYFDFAYNPTTGNWIRLVYGEGGGNNVRLKFYANNADTGELQVNSPKPTNGAIIAINWQSAVITITFAGSVIFTQTRDPAVYDGTSVRITNPTYGSFGNTQINQITYGALTTPVLLGIASYDAFTRQLNIPLQYVNVGASVPDYGEISYNGGAYHALMTASNPSAGVATFQEPALSTSITGTVNATVRMHNTPSANASFQFVAPVPFEKVLGVNGGGLSTDIFSDWEYINAQFADGSEQGIPNFADPVAAGGIQWSTDGLNGTVQRDQYNGVGKNSIGAVNYHYRRLFTSPTLIHAYIDWGAGVSVTPRYYGYPDNFSHNSTTGRSTFDLLPNKQEQIELLVNVASIPDGNILRAIAKDVAAPSVSPFVAAYTSVSAGIRFLDYDAINNAGNYTRTATALPVRTVSNRLIPTSYEAQCAALTATSSTAAYPINKIIDGTALVTAAADYYAANTPTVTKTFVGTSNEQFNVIFTQQYDAQIAGMRLGYGATNATPSTAVAETILDGQFPYLFPQLLVNTDSSGNAQGGGPYIKTLQPFNTGDKVFRNIGGAIVVYQFTQNTAAGYVFEKYNGNDHLIIKYPTDPCILAGKRWYSDLVVRNGNIWKARFAAAGKAAPQTVLEGQADDFNFVKDMLDWNNNYLSIDRVSQAPYFNNGDQGGGGFMDWNDATIWDATAKGLVSTGTPGQVLDYVFNKMLTNGIDRVVQKALNWCSQLRAYCVSKGLSPDAIKPIMYEFGDHDGFSGYNWPDQSKAQAFISNFWVDPRSYTLFLRYLTGLAGCGAPAFLYSMGPGGRPFNLISSSADTSDTNYYFKAMKDMQAKIAALP